MRRSLVLLMVAGIAVTGCQSVNWRFWESSSPPPPELVGVEELGGDPAVTDLPAEPTLRVATSRRFDDIPLPAGVNKSDERSYVFQNSSLRIGRMVYSSRAPMSELVKFFSKECPAADWMLNAVLDAEGTQTLTFTKGTELLQIIVKDNGTLRGREIEIHVTPNDAQ